MDAVLVFSGGANLGALQVGMLQAIVEAGIRPKAVVGASVGALNAACFAVDPTAERVERMKSVWLSLRREDVFAGSRLFGSARLAIGRRYMHEARGLRRLVADWFEPADLSQTAIPVHVATTALHSGEVRWWRAGPPADILVASAASPVVFPPVELDGDLHVDGALVEPLGLERAAALTSAPVLVLDAGATSTPLRPPQGAVSMIVAAIRAGRVARLAQDRARADLDRVLWLRAAAPHLAYHDFSHTAELIALGHAAAREQLTQLSDGHRTVEDPHPVAD